MGKSRDNSQDWKTKLAQVSQQMKDNMTEKEKIEYQKEERKQKKKEAIRKQNRYEINKRKGALYEFLAGYKQNSGIFINNFFRKRDYQTYCEDKFHSFDFDFHGNVLPNVFDDFSFSMHMVRYLKKLEESHLAYFPISKNYISRLINFNEVLELSDPLEEDTVFYRGCSTIVRNGVNGVVSVTSDRKIAEQFSRGTILTIHVPKGTRNININQIRPKEQCNKDFEQEFLLPPCEYEIISDKQVKSGREPNNMSGKTRLLEISVKPLNLLDEFLKVMDNPPDEYLPILVAQEGEYDESLSLLKNYMEQNQNHKSYTKVKK